MFIYLYSLQQQREQETKYVAENDVRPERAAQQLAAAAGCAPYDNKYWKSGTLKEAIKP